MKKTTIPTLLRVEKTEKVAAMWMGRRFQDTMGILFTLTLFVSLIRTTRLQENGGKLKKEKGNFWVTIFEEKHKNTYRYAKYLAQSGNHTNCYVCSKLPTSSTNPHVVPVPVKDPSTLFPECLVSAYSPTPLNMSLGNKLPPPVNTSVLTFKNFLALGINTTSKMYGPVHVSPKTNFTCYENSVPFLNKAVKIGKVPEYNCGVIYSPCTQNATGHFNQSEAKGQARCVPYFTVPDAMGTTPQSNFVWLCGLNVYANLPIGWQGRCAPMIPSHHSYVISAKPDYHHRERQDGNFMKHDSIWGTDVPVDHKLWTDGQKVVLALFHWVGVAKVMLRMETMTYRFESFVNTTIATLKGIKEELTALRLMEIQDRMVLDQLIASLRGVCAEVGPSCCTFIPENDADGQIIEQAITNLTALKDFIEAEKVTTNGLLQWLFGGSWWQILLKICTPIILILIMICMCLTCVIPCIMSMVRKMVQSILISTCLVNVEGGDYDQLLRRVQVVKDDNYDDIGI